MILQGLQQSRDVLTSMQATVQVDLHTCLATDCENFHVIGHLKYGTPTLLQIDTPTLLQIDTHTLLQIDTPTLLQYDTPTLLQYAKMLANIVHESVKRFAPWPVYYCTSPESYYPIPGGDHRYITQIPEPRVAI